MERIAEIIRRKHGRTATPAMVMIDGQTVRGGRAGPTFHEKGGRGGRTNGAKRSVVIDILGLPLAVSVESARPHDVSAGRRLLDTTLPALGTVQAVVADRGYRGLGKMTAKKGIRLDIKAPPKGTVGFTPIAPLYRVEHAFARLGRCGGCRGATRAVPRAHGRGSKSPPSATCSRVSGLSLPEPPRTTTTEPRTGSARYAASRLLRRGS